jgi:hypothetical protein
MTEAKLAKLASRIAELKGTIEVLQDEADDLRKEIISSVGVGEWYAGPWKVVVAERERKSLDSKMLEAKFGHELDPFRKVTQFTALDIKNVGKTPSTLL